MSFSIDIYPILLFDSECPLCVRFKEALLKTTGEQFAITCLDLHDQSIYESNSSLSYGHCKETLHLLVSPELTLTGDDVVKYLIHNFPQTKKFSWLIESSAGERAVGLFYKTLNKARKRTTSNCRGCGK